MSRKFVALLTAIVAYIFMVKIDSIYIKNDFDQPAKYKITYLSLNTISKLVNKQLFRIFF